MTTSPVAPTDTERLARAQADKAEADARAAAAAATTAERGVDEWNTASAQQQRDAESRKAVADADKATADARQSQITALVPDFSKVQGDPTTIQSQQPLFSSLLARHALDKAAKSLVEKIDSVVSKVPADDVILLTDDLDLATSDAAYTEVTSGFTELIKAVDSLPDMSSHDDAFGAVPLIAAAVASAVPPLLSLLTTKRSVSSFPITADNTAALAEVAGQLTSKGKKVRIDNFRLVPHGHVASLEQDLRGRRASLVTLKVRVDSERIQADTERASHQAEVDDLTKALHALPGPQDPQYAKVKADLATERAARDESANKTMTAATAVGVVTDLLASIDSFLVSIHAVPANGKRSPFVSAALREELRTADKNQSRIRQVVFVNASTGSVDQLFSDRPLWYKDLFEVIATVSMSYWVIDTDTSNVLSGGVADGSARMRGEIGSATIKITDVTDG